MDTTSIDSIHRSKTGKVSNKWDSYLTYYDFLFAPLRSKEISMLEIGVQNGGSLDTWSEYFENGRIFIGCDINEKCRLLTYKDPRIKVVVGSANEQKIFTEIISISPSYDIVIDDGSHMSIDILNSFVSYFPLLNPGGIYVVEDTHTLYMDSFGGGLLNEFSAYNFFKKLIDITNYQFWQDQISINSYLRTFFPLTNTPKFILDGWVESIEFRNSIIVIRKSLSPGHQKIGTSITTGTTALVETFGGKF